MILNKILMNKILIIFLSIILIKSSIAQTVVSDSVELGASYTNQVFYKLSDGSKLTASNMDWDICFNTSLFSVSARINGGVGVELYLPSNNDTSNFTTTTIDTVGATRLRDTYESWLEEGSSFVSVGTGHPDYGWVKYQGTGNLVGTKVFIVKTSGGVWKKVQLISGTSGGTYTLRFADLNGGNLTTQTIMKSTVSNKLNVYLDVDSNAVLDLEPVATDWDILFRTYEGDLGGGIYYNVTGALSNDGIGVAEVRNTPVTDAKSNWNTYALDSNIDVIGYDWKEFDMFQFKWVIEDSLSYIVQDKSQNIYQLIFSGWSGNSSGKGYFTVEQLSSANIPEKTGFASFGLYPNPAQDLLKLTYQIEGVNEVKFDIYTLSGEKVKSISGLNNTEINTSDIDISELSRGSYIIVGSTNKGMLTEKFMKL